MWTFQKKKRDAVLFESHLTVFFFPLPRQRRRGAWHLEVLGGINPRSGHGAPSEGQSGASPRKPGGSRGIIEGSHGVSKKFNWDNVLCCEACQTADESAEKSEQGQKSAARRYWKRSGNHLLLINIYVVSVVITSYDKSLDCRHLVVFLALNCTHNLKKTWQLAVNC